MEGNSLDRASQPPEWFGKLCQWLWKKQSFVWTTILLGIALNLFATWLSTPLSTDYKKLPIWVVFQNPIISLFIGILLLLLTFIIYLGSHFDNGITDRPKTSAHSPLINMDEKTNDPTLASDNEPKRRYLARMIRDNEILTLKGIPAGLIDKGVQLDEVFIPLELRPNRPMTEYPLTERELKRLHERVENGVVSEEMERILLEAERCWFHHHKPSDRISIADLWERLTSRHPAAIIQGYPGMGKSTLMARLTLHMARRSLNQNDATMPDQLEPLLIPIFLSLGRYATERAKAKKSDLILSLTAYLESILQQLNIPDLTTFIHESLTNGHCLILFDGLDEIGDLQMRNDIQEAIRAFITEQSDSNKEAINFNRFLITSRVAGYDQNAFPSYEHYTVAELTPKQIKEFLPRWCKATVHRDHNYASSNQDEQKEVIAREAEQIESKLNYAVMHNRSVRELVEIPLLLTLLAVMQQNSIELPRERVELYTVVTRTLLENRNIAKGLPSIPETLAIQRLGPIAFQMQEMGNSFIRLGEVLTRLREIIQNEQGGTADQVAQEAEDFLNRIRERAGLFTQRTGDYFSFFHRSFQEYFAARYILNEIKNNPDRWIVELLEKARRSDDLWREPFLFAVAYKSRDDETVARQIIQNLLDNSQISDFNARAHDILLVGECLVEAKPLTIGSTIEKQIAEQLLQIYEEAQKNQRFTICTQVEEVVRRWLTSLPNEAYRPVLLTFLSETISDTNNLVRQYASLTLLAMISGKLSFCSSIVFNTLIPPLLKLAGQPELSLHLASVEFPKVEDFPLADLAITILSVMGSQGPGGLLLADVRKHFKSHPQHLQLLAKHSLEMGTLLTPIIIPSSPENYQNYIAAIKRWFSLREQEQKNNDTNEALNVCCDIHQILLTICEEIRYPSIVHFLNVLRAAESFPTQSGREVWQTYLSAQINANNYINYQEIIILWILLFHDKESTKYMTKIILKHFFSDTFLHRFSQVFIATLCDLLKIEYDMQFQMFTTSRAMTPNSRLINLSRCLGFVHSLNQLNDLYYTREGNLQLNGEFWFFSTKSSGTSIKYLVNREFINVSFHECTINFDNFLKYLLNSKVISKTLDFFSASLSSKNIEAQKELISILLGRMILIQRSQRLSDTVKQEIQRILSFVHFTLPLLDNKEVSNAMLNILSYLPAHSSEEIQYIINLIENTSDSKLQQAYAEALKRSMPRSSENWATLEAAIESKIDSLSSAAKERLQLKKQRKVKLTVDNDTITMIDNDLQF